jgi:DNA-binding beta-propeller fold protein YncE
VGSNTTGKVSVIATQSGQIAHTFDGVTFPYRITASPDGRLMAIVDGKGDRVFFADVSGHTLLGSVPLTQPRGVAFSPDSKTAFVTLAHGELAVVDVATRTMQRTIAVQQSPDGVAVRYRAL